jgi:hypothetical protein
MGIAVFQAVISSGLESRFPKLEGFGTQFGIPRDLNGYHRLHDLPQGPMRDAALTAFSHSLRVVDGESTPWLLPYTFLTVICPSFSYVTRSGHPCLEVL